MSKIITLMTNNPRKVESLQKAVAPFLLKSLGVSRAYMSAGLMRVWVLKDFSI